MKILHAVQSYYPSPGGMQEVVKQLSERLVQLGHDVTVVTSYDSQRSSSTINGVNIKSFAIRGNYAEGLYGEVEEYKNYLLNADFDVITFFASQQWSTDIALPLLDKIKAKKVVVPTGYSALYDPLYKSYFEKMKEWLKGFDMNVYLSHHYRDINFARECGIDKITVIPNGAADEEFSINQQIDVRKKFGIKSDDFLILHVGSYTGRKGHKEAIELFLKSNLKKATLLLIGNNNERFKRLSILKHPGLLWLWLKKSFSTKKIILTSTDRITTVETYKESDLFLFPSNIECSPIVLFECMASKTPFLTADVGNSQEIVEWSNAGIVLPTHIDKQGYSHVLVDQSIPALEDIYQDKEKRKKMSLLGYEAWKSKFTWKIITKQYETLYKSLLN